MDQDIITRLEERVVYLLDAISSLRRENVALKAQLNETATRLEAAEERIRGLEASKETALERIRAILDKIDATNSGDSENDNDDTLEVAFKGENSQQSEETGVKTLF